METKSLISNQEIYQKCSNGSRSPFKGSNELFNVLYKTTCLVNGKVYVGVHSTKNLNDHYLGCGIKGTYSTPLKNYRISRGDTLGASILKYGVESFEREDLLFFDNIDEALEQEKLVVDWVWIRDSRTLNVRPGGNKPPKRSGISNGNYGKKWTDAQRKAVSEVRKRNGKSVGSNNPNAKPIVMINAIDLNVFEFDSAYAAQKEISPDGNVNTLRTFLQKGKMFEKKWIPLYREDYLRLKDIKPLVLKYIEESRFVKQLKAEATWI